MPPTLLHDDVSPASLGKSFIQDLSHDIHVPFVNDVILPLNGGAILLHPLSDSLDLFNVYHATYLPQI